MLFTFVGEGLNLSSPVLNYFPRGQVGESCVVYDAHLFILQIHASSFGAGHWTEMVCHFSQCIMVHEGIPWVRVPRC
jgi:hypothetical protein